MTSNWVALAYHARVQGFIIAGSSVGAAISPQLFSWMMVKLQWRTPFLIAGLATATLAAIWSWYARDYPGTVRFTAAIGTAQLRQPWVTLFTDRNLMLITFAYAYLGYFQSFSSTGSITILEKFCI
jgi:MFS family permease